MGQSVTISPTLKVLLPVFLERCAAMRCRLAPVPGDGLSWELVEDLRRVYLTPLTSPSHPELAEELPLITTLSIVIDLITQGWRIISTEPSLVLEFERSASPAAEKERIRRGHLIDRDTQLREPAVSAFIKGMERRRLTPRGWHSIFSLMRDGQDLAHQLAEVRAIEYPEMKIEQIARVIQPYLQFVDPEGVCEHTGLRLSDVWRYFRHTWVNSYKSNPGRSMMILVRDAAAPYHPIIGIACLGSSVVQ
ncbi:MAG: hypothetical protein HYZ72_19470 [Deltaproteobacteria bacterium]|nr:hypothetical protein [Deltaproteobacteria bacterium]